MKEYVSIILDLLKEKRQIALIKKTLSIIFSLNMMYWIANYFQVSFQLPSDFQPATVIKFVFDGKYLIPIFIFTFLQWLFYVIPAVILEASVAKWYNRLSLFFSNTAFTGRDYLVFLGLAQRIPFVRIPIELRHRNFNSFCKYLRSNCSKEHLLILERRNQIHLQNTKQNFRFVFKAIATFSFLFLTQPSAYLWAYIPIMVALLTLLLSQYVKYLVLLLLPVVIRKSYDSAIQNELQPEPPLVVFNS